MPSISLVVVTSFLLFCTLFISTQAATFLIQNSCGYTVWAAASPGGGRALGPGQAWTLDVAAGTKMARIWGRTGCNFDGNGRGRCETGDCGQLNCQGWGTPPNTLAEYALNQYGNLDFFDISLVDGFNIPMVFTPTNNFGDKCRAITCTANINGECPGPLRVNQGCLNPCQVFKTPQYCCNNIQCGPTDYSRFFKQRCQDAYSYPQDDPTSTFTCPGGTNYKVVFCPPTGSNKTLALWKITNTYSMPVYLLFTSILSFHCAAAWFSVASPTGKDIKTEFTQRSLLKLLVEEEIERLTIVLADVNKKDKIVPEKRSHSSFAINPPFVPVSRA